MQSRRWSEHLLLWWIIFLLPEVEETTFILTLFLPWDKTESLWKFLPQGLLLVILQNSSIRIILFLSLSLRHLCAFHHHNHIFLIINLLCYFFLTIPPVSSTVLGPFFSPCFSKRPSVWSTALFQWFIFVQCPLGSPLTNWEAAHILLRHAEGLASESWKKKQNKKTNNQEIRNKWPSCGSWSTLVMQVMICEPKS